jgi:hypothetical protein
VVSRVVGSGVSYFNIHSHVYLTQARHEAAAADRMRSRASQRAEKKKWTLRIRLAVLRKARNVAAARSAWSAVRGQLSASRLQRAQAVRPKRMSAVLHDIAVQRKHAKLARKTKEKGVPPARTARLNLTAAATVGPVLTDMYVAARGPMGDG